MNPRMFRKPFLQFEIQAVVQSNSAHCHHSQTSLIPSIQQRHGWPDKSLDRRYYKTRLFIRYSGPEFPGKVGKKLFWSTAKKLKRTKPHPVYPKLNKIKIVSKPKYLKKKVCSWEKCKATTIESRIFNFLHFVFFSNQKRDPFQSPAWMKNARGGHVRNINFIFARIAFQKLKMDHWNWFKDHVEIENIIACIERGSSQENIPEFVC